jgi:diguanylate cyclase (GGDEF)-like protein/PAS domain S-box-containing protein
MINQVNPFIFLLLLGILFAGGLCIFLWPRRSTPGTKSLIVLLIAVSEWSAAYILELLGSDLATKHLWAQFQYFGIVALPVAWLYFTLNFTRQEDKLTHHPWRRFGLFLVPVLTLVMIWVPGLQTLIWVRFNPGNSGPFTVTNPTFGVGFWVFTAYTYGLFLFGAYLLLKLAFRSQGLYWNQVVAILLAILAPLLGNVMYLFHFNPFPGLDLSPFGFTLSGLALGWSILAEGMMGLLPIARSTVVEKMQSGIIVLDLQDRILDINPSAEDLLGVSMGELIGAQFALIRNIWPELDASFHNDRIGATQKVIQREQKGVIQWFDLRVSDLLDNRHQPIGTLINLIDITARRQERAALQEFRQAVNVSGEAIFMTDVTGLITYINPEFTRLYGYTPEEVIGKTTPLILKSGMLAQADYESFWQTLLNKQAFKGQLVNKTKDGRLITIEVSGNPIIDNNSETIGFLAIQHDITQEIQARENLQRHLEELTFLHAIALTGVEATDEDILIKQATQLVGDSLFSQNFGVLLVDQSDGTLFLHSSYNITRETKDLRIPLGEGITGAVALTGVSKYTPDIRKEPNYVNFDPEIRSELCVPIKANGQVIGVLNVESNQVDAFNEWDKNLLTTFASQLAIAVVKLRLLKAERVQINRQTALLQLSTVMANALYERDIVESAVNTLKTTLGYDHLGLFLLDENTGDRVLAASEGWPDAQKGWRIPPGKGLSSWSVETGQLRYAPDVSLYPEHVPGIAGGVSEVDVPLRVGEKVLGVLIAERIQNNAFNEQDLAVLTASANQLAVAIERARLFQQVEQLAITDELTGLNNRRHFFALGETEFSRALRFDRPLSAIMIDVDHFKLVNDTYGHLTGDIVLREIATRCLKNIRTIDIIGRYGGEEFAVILPETKLEDATCLAERLRVCMDNESVLIDSNHLHITLSLGVATLTSHNPDLGMLLNQADEALLQAKRSGRNRVVAGK